MAYQYSFILGRTPQLSRAELDCILSGFTLSRWVAETNEFAIIETAAPLDTSTIINRLGGTIKIGEIFYAAQNIHQPHPKDFISFLRDRVPAASKLFFGISLYGKLHNTFNAHKFGIAIKSSLKNDLGINSRLVSSRDSTLSSVVVATNKLLSNRGAEIQLLPANGTLYAARTAAVQDFASFSARDFGRPAADPKSGMLPPKVARMMVNIAQPLPKETLLDPFCGSGTILMEAGLVYPELRIIGNDLNEHAIQNTQNNIRWLGKKYPTFSRNIELLNTDIAGLPSQLRPHSIDIIVTEPYLGPALRGALSKQKIEHIIHTLNQLYADTLNVFYTLLKPSGRAIMIWPEFMHQKNRFILPAFKKITDLFHIIPILPASPTVLYARPDQKVARRIIKFKPKT